MGERGNPQREDTPEPEEAFPAPSPQEAGAAPEAPGASPESKPEKLPVYTVVYRFALMPPTPNSDCDWAVLSAKNLLTGLAMFFDDLVKDGKQLGDRNDQVKRELEEWYQKGETHMWFEKFGKQYTKKIEEIKRWALETAKWLDDMIEAWNRAVEEGRRACHEKAR